MDDCLDGDPLAGESRDECEARQRQRGVLPSQANEVCALLAWLRAQLVCAGAEL